MSAILSPCGQYRYRLERHVDLISGPVYGFVGVNPSTADATEDDHTVRKWTGFTRAWGGSRYIVGNLFALRSTDVNLLRGHNDPVGVENDEHLRRIAAEADILVPCWGSRGKMPRYLRPRCDDVFALLKSTGKPLMHLGLTASGDPKHPLTLGYATPLLPFASEATP